MFRCSAAWFDIFATDESGRTLEEFADGVASFRLSARNEELHFVSRSEIALDDGRPAIRLEYRIQTGTEYCIERRVSVMTLVNESLGIEMISMACEDWPTRFGTQLESMQMSFVP